MVSQTNYTLTYYADHQPKQISHDRINGYLRNDRLTPSLVWEKVKNDIVIDPEGYLRTCSQSFQQQSDESEIGKLKA